MQVLAGHDRVRFRMYPGGVRQLIEGWTKNLAAGAGRARRLHVLAVVAWITACLQVTIDLVVRRDAVALVAYGVVAAHLAWLARRVGDFRWWAIAGFPVPLVCFVAVFARSIVHTYVRHEVRWRGRTLPIGGRASGPVAP